MAVGKRFSYEPERLADDLFAIPLPLHDGSPVNSYVAIGADGVRLIDGGLGTEECQAALERGLNSLGFALSDVKGLFITHGHTDHVGAAHAIASNGGEIVAHRLEWPAPTRVVEDGDHLAWGNLNLEVVWCPGHTRGLVCLYEAQRRLLFTTDHVMRRAPAPISLREDTSDDPLGDYLASVRKLEHLDVHTVLPGHGRPFTGLRQRLHHIVAEIEHQLGQIRAALASGPATAHELLAIEGLRDRRPVAERYAVSQVLARVRHLERLGEVAPLDGTPVRYLARAASTADTWRLGSSAT